MLPKRINGKDLNLGRCEAHGCSHYVMFRTPLGDKEAPPRNYLLCEVDAFNYGRSIMDTATSREGRTYG